MYLLFVPKITKWGISVGGGCFTLGFSFKLQTGGWYIIEGRKWLEDGMRWWRNAVSSHHIQGRDGAEGTGGLATQVVVIITSWDGVKQNTGVQDQAVFLNDAGKGCNEVKSNGDRRGVWNTWTHNRLGSRVSQDERHPSCSFFGLYKILFL